MVGAVFHPIGPGRSIEIPIGRQRRWVTRCAVELLLPQQDDSIFIVEDVAHPVEARVRHRRVIAEGPKVRGVDSLRRCAHDCRVKTITLTRTAIVLIGRGRKQTERNDVGAAYNLARLPKLLAGRARR